MRRGSILRFPRHFGPTLARSCLDVKGPRPIAPGGRRRMTSVEEPDKAVSRQALPAPSPIGRQRAPCRPCGEKRALFHREIILRSAWAITASRPAAISLDSSAVPSAKKNAASGTPSKAARECFTRVRERRIWRGTSQRPRECARAPRPGRAAAGRASPIEASERAPGSRRGIVAPLVWDAGIGRADACERT